MKLSLAVSVLLILVTSNLVMADSKTFATGYRCQFTVSQGGDRGPKIGQCEDRSLKTAREMMFRRAAELRGTPGACFPTTYVGSGCSF